MTDTINLLLIEDHAGDARLVQEYLAHVPAARIDFRHAGSLQEGLTRLAEEDVDVVLLDLGLPDSQGMETFHAVRGAAAQVPVLIVTGLLDEELAVRAVQAGAQDYLVKDELGGQVLSRAIRYARERHRMLRALQENARALKAGEARFRKLVEHNADGIVIVDSDGIIRLINPALSRLLDLSKEELVGQPFGYPLQPDWDVELDLPRQNGDTTTAEMRAVESEWEGKPAFLASLRDITARKKMETALQESEALYRNLVETSPDAISLTDLEGNLQFANETAAKLHGYDRPEEMVGLNAFDLIIPEDREWARENLSRTLTEGSVRNLEYRLRRKDGSHFSAELSASLIQDTEGHPKAFIGLVRDVTERKRAERQFSKTVRALRVLSASNEAVLMARDESALLDQVCQIIVEEGGYRLSWVGFVEDGKKTVAPVAQAGFEEGYLETLDVSWADEARGRGPVGKAIRTGKPSVSRNITTDPDFLPWREEASRRGYGSALALPLKIGQRSIGVLAIYAAEPDAFDPDDMELLGDLTGTLAYGIQALRSESERLAVEDRLRQQLEELEVLNAVAKAGTEATDEDTLLDCVTEIIGEALYPDHFGVLLFDERRGTLRPHASYRGIQPEDYRREIPLGMGVTGKVAASGAPALVPDVRDEGGYLAVTEGMRSELAVPLKAQSRILGVVNAELARPNAFKAQDLQLMTTLADQLATAIHKIRLLERERIRRQESETLRAATTALTSTLEMDEVFQEILAHLAQIISYQNANIFLIRGDQAELVATRGNRNQHTVGASFSITGDSLHHEMVASGEPVTLHDAATDDRFQMWGAQEPIHGWMMAPLIVHDQVIGFLTMDSDRPRAYGRSEAASAQTFANQAAIALDRARLFSETKQRLEEVSLLSEVIAVTVAARDLTTAMTRVCEEVAQYLQVPQAGFALLNEDGSMAEVTAEYRAPGRPSALGVRIPVAENASMVHLLNHKTALAVSMAQEDHRLAIIREEMREHGIASILLTPILVDDQVVGTLGFDSLEPREFSVREVQLVEDVSRQVGLGLERLQLLQSTQENADLMERLAELSERLNQKLTVEEVTETIGRGTQKLSATSHVAVFLLPSDDAEGKVVCGWSNDLSPDFVDSIADHALHVPVDLFREQPSPRIFSLASPPGLPAITGRPLSSRTQGAFQRMKEIFQAAEVEAVGMYPLMYEGRVIAVVVSFYPEPRQWSPAEYEVLSAFARQSAVALENARLFEEAERRLSHLQALRAVDVTISASMDLRLSLETLLGQVLMNLEVDAADVLIYNRVLSTLEFMAGRGFRTQALKFTNLRLGEGAAGRAALNRQIIHIPDLDREQESLSQSKLLPKENFVSYHGVPLIAKGELKGVLEIFHRSALDPGPEWLDFLQSLATQAAIAIDNAELFEGLQRSNVELRLAYDATLEGWVRALDLYDKETEGHTRRVTDLTLQLAKALGMSEEEIVHVRRGALLHDIGKMGIPDRILNKPGPLTDEEWEIMRQHPVYAYEMLSQIDYLKPALDIPYHHHEKWDGTGYPLGLKGDEIPLAARIFAVVDVWDALRSDRPYREAWPELKVRAYLQEQSGKHFDPHILSAFLEITAV